MGVQENGGLLNKWLVRPGSESEHTMSSGPFTKGEAVKLQEMHHGTHVVSTGSGVHCPVCDGAQDAYKAVSDQS